MMNMIHLARVDLNLLVLFEAVLAERHVGRAADRMHLTPSAVSHGLRRLRQLLGDPLFLRTPKGVVPTARALELADAVTDILTRVRGVLAGVAPFEPATAARRFLIGAPDGVSAVFLPRLLDAIQKAAPGVDVGVRQLLPAPGQEQPERAWRPAFDELEEGSLDVAIIPMDSVPARFHARPLYDEDFVVGVRSGHPSAKTVTLARYCELRHLVVSTSGDAHGFVDTLLARHGRMRRVVATVPNFMLALAVIGETDLVSALPRAFVSEHGARFGVVAIEPPIALGSFRLQAVALAGAMADAGIAWLFATLDAIRPATSSRRLRKRKTHARSRLRR